MNANEMVELVRAQNKVEKPTKGLTEWTTNETLAQAMKLLGFTVVETPATSYMVSIGHSGNYWKLNCNGNRFRAIKDLIRAAGGM